VSLDGEGLDADSRRALVDGAERIGIALSDEQVAKFEAYQALLERWNARIKLTTVVEARAVVERHFLDSLAIVPFVGAAKTLVDVGSGAGFPGVPVQIALPELRVACVESIQKKAAFLGALKRELRLPALEVLAVRSEALVASERRFDLAVSRATMAPERWLAGGEELLAAGGTLIAMLAPEAMDSAIEVARQRERRYTRPLLVHEYAPGRALVVLRDRRP